MALRGPTAVWLLVCVLGTCLAASAQDRNFWAVVVGVSKFKNFKATEQLEFAHADAETFAKFIKSQRGRAFPDANIKLILNEDATLGRIRSTLGTWVQRSSKPNDIVYIFIATHGMVEKDASKAAFLVTSDADPEDLYSTALPMSDLGDIITTRLGKAGRIVLFADACRSGKLGEQQKGIHRQLENVASKNAELIGLMASRPTEFSQEGKQFCGGHGAFTCFLLRGLDGSADADKDKTVTVTELIDYLAQNIPKVTEGQQHIREFGSYENEAPLAYIDKAGAELGFPAAFLPPWPRYPGLLAGLHPALAGPASELRTAFDRAVKEGRLLAPEGQSAWDLYQKLMQSPAPPAEKEDVRDSLAIALEDEGQKILVAYLRGDASPPTVHDYRYGADLFTRASGLSPDVPKLKAKARFFEGRTLLSEGKFMEAEPALKDSIGIDPDGGYSFNALGIAYMHQRRFAEAMESFQAAVERAPKWAYPHYNRALTYVAMGQLQEAERAYKDAIERGPSYAYLHLNLGELYLRMNRQSDAEKSFKKAIELGPNLPFSYNMLGVLYRHQGKLREAEQQFRRAVEVRPDRVDTRLNLAWTLIERNAREEAERVLREALQVDMHNADIHRELGALLLARDALAEAETEFIFLQKVQPNDPVTFSLLGDLYTAQKRFADAANAYRMALQLGPNPELSREVKQKLRRVEKQQ